MVDCPAVRSIRRGVALRLRRACAERDSRQLRRHRSWRHAAIAQPPCRPQRRRWRRECIVWRRSQRQSLWGYGRCRYGGRCIPEPRASGGVDDSVHVFVDVVVVRTGSVDDFGYVVVDVLVVRAGCAVRDGVGSGVPPRPLRAKSSNRRAQPVRRSRIAAHRPPEDRACAIPGARPRRLRGSARGRADPRFCVSEFRHDDRTSAWANGFATATCATPRTWLRSLRPRPGCGG